MTFALTTDLSKSTHTSQTGLSLQDAGEMVEQLSGVTHQLHLSPRWIGQLVSGAKESLKGMLMGWHDSMHAIPLQLHSVRMTDNTGRIINENPCVHVTVKARWTVFKPKTGALLKGVIRQQTPEHISLLILGYFNATIPANQLSTGYRWNQLRGLWESLDGAALLCGAPLEFMVIEVRRDASLITIIGSMDKQQQESRDKKRSSDEQEKKKKKKKSRQ